MEHACATLPAPLICYITGQSRSRELEGFTAEDRGTELCGVKPGWGECLECLANASGALYRALRGSGGMWGTPGM